MYCWQFFIAACLMLAPLSICGQSNVKPKDLLKTIEKTDEPIFLDGERVYRGREVTSRVRLLKKPEPQFTEKARKKKTHGTVQLLTVFGASGEVKVISVVKRLKNGLTEQAMNAATQIQFTPASLDGKAVPQLIMLEYHFNID